MVKVSSLKIHKININTGSSQIGTWCKPVCRFINSRAKSGDGFQDMILCA